MTDEESQARAWKEAADELRSDPIARAELLASVYWVSQGDGPRAVPDREMMERILDEVLDGPPLILVTDSRG